jgi:hypothetical protein
MTQDEQVWRKRFAVFALLRLSGMVLFLLGMAIVFSDLVRFGGALGPGMVVIAIGLIEALLGPVLLRQHWEKADRR